MPSLDQSISIVHLLIVLIPMCATALYSFYRLIFRVNELQQKIFEIKQENLKTIQELKDEIKDTRKMVSLKNDKIYQEVKSLEQKFQKNNETLIEIKTMVKLLSENKLKHKNNEDGED